MDTRCRSLVGILLLLACEPARESPPPEQVIDTPNPGHFEKVIGDWEKEEQTLPPIHLRLWLEQDTLRARLRLSGSESIGTATFNGSQLRLDLSGRPEQLIGELVRVNELELRFGARAYRLRKQSNRGIL